jgi:5'-phosphate synthase pdxT subunit
MHIGVLALQGDFEKHIAILDTLEVTAARVKTADQLAGCDGLIIPGGESTTFTLLLRKHGLWEELSRFAAQHPVFGTCAGLIILAKKLINEQLDTLQLLDIEVERNAYGRQIDSFIDTIDVTLGDEKFNFEGVFIRAPKIKKVGSGIKKLAYHKNEVVMAESRLITVATFHPELTDDTRIHQYFCRKVEAQSAHAGKR